MDAFRLPQPAHTVQLRNAEGIRGLACLIVLAGHGVSMFFPETRAALMGVGRLGVWLFFVLSAFLLTNHLLAARVTGARMVDYAVGRVLRIMPLYLIAIGVYWWLGTAGINSADDAMHAATLSAGYAHLWTIPVEMKFYLLLAASILPLAWIYARFGTVAALAVVALVGAAATPFFPPSLAYTDIVRLGWYVPCFMAGVALALLQPRLPPVRPWLAALLGALVLLGFVLSTNVPRTALGGPASPYWPFDKFIPMSIAWTLFIAVQVNQGGWLERLWHTPVLRLTGRWSYPIYLFHWLALQKLAPHHGNATVFLLAIAVTMAVAAAAHRWIERPAMALRPRVVRYLTATRAAPSATPNNLQARQVSRR